MAKKRKITKQATEDLNINSLPQEVVEEVVAAPIIEVEKEPVPAPVVKKEPAPVVEDRKPGMYYQGKWVSAVPAKFGRKWTILVEGRRIKVNQSEIEIVRRK